MPEAYDGPEDKGWVLSTDSIVPRGIRGFVFFGRKERLVMVSNSTPSVQIRERQAVPKPAPKPSEKPFTIKIHGSVPF
jgi:hypothetical protein